MTAGYSSVMESVYLQSKYIYVYITKKMSAYSHTEECWLEILYAHSAAASLKVDGVKYKGKKIQKAQDPFWRLVPIQSNFSRNYYICYSCMFY